MSRRQKLYALVVSAVIVWVLGATLTVFAEELPLRLVGAVLLGGAVGLGVWGGFGLRHSR